MSVFAQVSSIKTKRRGSSRPWYFSHCARRLAIHGCRCSAGSTHFFEAQTRGMNEPPDLPIINPDAALGQIGDQTARRKVARRPLYQPVTMPRQDAHLVSANLAGSCATARSRKSIECGVLIAAAYKTGQQLESENHVVVHPVRFSSMSSRSKPRGEHPGIDRVGWRLARHHAGDYVLNGSSDALPGPGFLTMLKAMVSKKPVALVCLAAVEESGFNCRAGFL